jgi:hypothetical protein
MHEHPHLPQHEIEGARLDRYLVIRDTGDAGSGGSGAS